MYIHFKYKYFLAPHMRFEINTGQKLELILLVDKKQIEDDKDKEVTTKQPEQPIVEKTNLNPNNAALSI